MSISGLVTNGLGGYTTLQKFLMLGLWPLPVKGSVTGSTAVAHAVTGSEALRGAAAGSDAARHAVTGSDS